MFKSWGVYRSGLGFFGCVLIGIGFSLTANAGYTNGPDPHGKPCANGCCIASCSQAAGDSSSATGMPTYGVNPMLIGLVLQDTPLGYTPPKGPTINFQLTYNQKDTDQPTSFTFGNVGPKWAFNWLEYVQDDPANIGSNVLLYLPDGQGRAYNTYNSSTGAFAREPETGAILVLLSISPVIYERRMPDGSKEVFSASDGGISYPRRVFLTQRVDAHGNAVTLAYDGQQRLTRITDALGQTSTFQYGNSNNPLLLTGISDPFGRMVSLSYDGSGRLSSITDVIGMTSSFGYVSGTQINSLTTPYGTTTFDYGESSYHYWLNVTDINGNTSRWEFMQGAPGIPYSENLVPTGMQTANRYLNGRDSFYWDPVAYQQAAGDYTKALMYHWNHLRNPAGGDYLITSDSLESIKYPLENRIWYSHPDTYSGGVSGTLNAPIGIGRVLADGSTQLTTHQYNSQGNVTQIIDATGLETDTTYAANGIDPIQINYTGPGGYHASESFTYDGQHEPLTHTDESGATTTYTYNAAGQRTSVTDPLGHTTHYDYDGNGYLTSVVDANGHTASYTYDAVGRTASETDPLGNTKTYTYDTLNRITRITYWDGTYEENTYDKLDRVAYRDRNSNFTHYAYDGMRNLVSITDPLGHVTSFSYYPNNLLKNRTDSTGGVTTWTRDIEGRVTQRQDPNGGVTTFAYDVGNRKTSETNPLGQTTSYLAYDGDNRLTRMTDSNGVETDMSYHPRGWPSSRSVLADGTSATTTMTYDTVGDLSSVTEADGVMTVFIYDAAHRLTDVGDAMGNSIGYTLDAVGNRIAEKTFDANGVLARSLTRTFDARNEMTSETNGQGNTTTFGYDANGNRSDEIDPLGARTHWTFDAGNRLVSSIRNYLGTDPATTNTTTGYAYDAANHLVAVTDPDNLITGYQVDAMGRVTKLTSPDTGTTTYTYDVAGNRTSQTDARGITSTYTYDALNRLTSISYPTAGLDVHYYYDEPDSTTGCSGSYPIDHLTRMTDSSGNTAWCYDDRGNVVAKQITVNGNPLVGGTVAYAYDLASRLMGIAYPSGPTVTYTRDGNGRIASVSTILMGGGNPVSIVSGITYLPFGPATQYSFAQGGQTLTKTYDYAYRSTGVLSAPLYLQLALDAVGNPVSAKTDPNQTSPVETYQYDPLYRLQQVDDATGAPWQSYSYDRTGDRLSKTTAGIGTDTYQYQSSTHRLINIVGAEPLARAMDANGNTTAFQANGWTYGLGYDDRNRLVVAQLNGGTIATYRLNGLGERVQASPPGTFKATTFAYDEDGRRLSEYFSSSASMTKAYVWADDTLVATIEAPLLSESDIHYVYTDGLGTPRTVTTTTSNTPIWTWPWLQNPFGERAASGNGYGINLRFPGQYYSEVGLHYNYFRDYEPGTGRYIESDPVGLAGGQNTYAYVKSNPLIASDEHGLWPYYGKWCGPDWTGGRKEEYNPAHSALYEGPVDNLDTACMHHDVCYYKCRNDHPCNAMQRGQCMTQCDRSLAMEVAVIGRGKNGRGALLFAWMQYNHSPNPGPDATNCPQCHKN